MKTTILLLLLAVSAYATPAGILTWGDPTINWCTLDASTCLISPLLDDLTGISTQVGGWSPIGWNGAQYSISRPFTVTSGGGFNLTNFIGVTGSGEYINPGNASAPLQVDFMADGFGVSLSGNGTTATSDSAWFMTPLVVAGYSSDVLLLDPGNYVLQQMLNAEVMSAGSTQIWVQDVTDLVGVDPPDAPAVVPEPHYLLWMIGLGAAVWLYRLWIKGIVMLNSSAVSDEDRKPL